MQKFGFKKISVKKTQTFGVKKFRLKKSKIFVLKKLPLKKIHKYCVKKISRLKNFVLKNHPPFRPSDHKIFGPNHKLFYLIYPTWNCIWRVKLVSNFMDISVATAWNMITIVQTANFWLNSVFCPSRFALMKKFIPTADRKWMDHRKIGFWNWVNIFVYKF